MSFIRERRSQVKAVVQIPAWSKICLSSFEIFFFFYLYSFRCFQSKNNVWRIWKGLKPIITKKIYGETKRKTIVFVVKFNLLLFFIINREYFDTDFAINAKTISTKGNPKIFSI
jgi:hypothetical protein